MPLTPDNIWYPNIFGKQIDIYNWRKRICLVSGPSLSGKSYGVWNKLARHLWDTDRAKMAFFSKTLKGSKEAGAWSLFNDTIIPDWCNSGTGFRYTTKDNTGKPGWKTSGTTRTPFFKCTNQHGTESECYLFSLDYVHDIESMIKEQAFSAFYFSELDKFTSRKVLSISLPRLRLGHVKFEDEMWIADTNPSEEGDESWIYKLWYKERTMDYQDYLDYCKIEKQIPLMEEAFLNFQSQLGLIEMFPEDNIRLAPEKLQELKNTYSYDPILYARYVKGAWVFHRSNETFHFRGVFDENLHVLGDASGEDEEKWLTILPSRECTELVTGWDLGEVNHAAIAAEKREFANRKHFYILDELEFVGENVSIEDFTVEFMGICELLERAAGRALSFENAWSDSSALERYSSAGDTMQANIVAATSDGRFILQGVEKASGSVAARVQLLKMLLTSGRIKISANCKAVIRMLKNLRKGKGRLNFVVGDDKHIFDALTYMLIKECGEEYEAVIQHISMGSRSDQMATLTQI